MLPIKFTGEEPPQERARYKIVRSDTLRDVPGEILSADTLTGKCSMREVNGLTTEHSFGENGLRIVARILLIAALLCGGLTACAQVQGDLANAAALATAAGDTEGAACATALQAAVASTPMPADDGAFTLIERKRLAKGALQSTACAPIVVELVASQAHLP